MGLTRERLEQLVARSSDSIVGTDRSGHVIYWNDGAKKVLGYEDEEVLGTHVGRLYPDMEEAKCVMRAMRQENGDGKDVVNTFQTTFMAKNGERIPVAISGTILRDEEGGEDGTIGFAKDLREILRKDQLATLGEVAIGLSHEINNPLNVILNQATLLERDIDALADDGDISVENERLDAIRREISRISEIVERLGEMVEEDTYETKGYIGPARMVDLRQKAERHQQPMEGLEGLRILVADDDGGIVRSLKEILTRDGCQVTTASDGREALAALDEAEFDIVLSDVVMPNMDGYELFKAIQEGHPGLPVLMMTAFHFDKDHIIKRSRVAGLGAVLFKKPVDPNRLRQTILEAVRS
ncbi:MAG: response regulator [bacterium]|nr:response regulator [bacterium]MCP5065260.1 response regulator [bacterium]